VQLEISIAYAKREKVADWIESYAQRNKIPVSIVDWNATVGGERARYVLHFKSKSQARAFVQRGNKEYPTFEFH
jgi:hypothetical protein